MRNPRPRAVRRAAPTWLLACILSLPTALSVPAAARASEAGGGPKVIRGGESAAPQLRWFELEEALSEARSRKKPLLVDVYTNWCGWCRRMDRDTYAAPDVRTYLGQAFVPVRLNAEDTKKHVVYEGDKVTYAEFASGFGVSGYPTTLFLSQDGALITKVPGYVNAPRFLQVLRFIGDGHYKNKSWDAYQQESPGR